MRANVLHDHKTSFLRLKLCFKVPTFLYPLHSNYPDILSWLFAFGFTAFFQAAVTPVYLEPRLTRTSE